MPRRLQAPQCAVGHLLCATCCDKLRNSKCPVCFRTGLERCFGMEHAVESIFVPCSYANYGCTEMITYHQVEHHQKACPLAPFFCPGPGCGFAGSTAKLFRHFAARPAQRVAEAELQVLPRLLPPRAPRLAHPPRRRRRLALRALCSTSTISLPGSPSLSAASSISMARRKGPGSYAP
ncbi:hypothetical protein ACP70R_030370 [Stipagrostis hirtigluma subsp. patula]